MLLAILNTIALLPAVLLNVLLFIYVAATYHDPAGAGTSEYGLTPFALLGLPALFCALVACVCSGIHYNRTKRGLPLAFAILNAMAPLSAFAAFLWILSSRA